MTRVSDLAGLIAACESALKAQAIDCYCDGDEGEVGEHEEDCARVAVHDALEAVKRAAPPLAEDGELVKEDGAGKVTIRAVLAALDARLEVKP
jgi:hypothetical protein